MTVHGKVKGSVVVLEKGANLPEGALVDVSLARSKIKKRKASRPGKRQADISNLRTLLLKFAGTAKNLPPDLAENHDHYIHGTPRK